MNTRSRSLQSIRHSTDDGDESLVARRRRRRGDRAHTTHVNPADIPDSDENTTHSERRKGRPRSLYHQSVDENEVFYDADSRHASGQRV